MGRFVYEEGDTEFIDLQCEVCLYWVPDTPDQCAKYDRKPDDVMRNVCKCCWLEWKDPLPF